MLYGNIHGYIWKKNRLENFKIEKYSPPSGAASFVFGVRNTSGVRPRRGSVWRSPPPNAGEFPKIFKIFIKEIAKCIILNIFQNVNKQCGNFSRVWKTSTNCWWSLRNLWKSLIKIQWNIASLTIFGKVVGKNRIFRKNIIFWNNYFLLGIRSVCPPGGAYATSFWNCIFHIWKMTIDNDIFSRNHIIVPVIYTGFFGSVVH